MSDAQQFRLPDVGEGLTEAEIVTWKVKPGDTVKVNDVSVEIETAKSLVELPSPYAGTVTDLLVNEGDTVAVGTPIITVSPAGSSAPAPSAEEEVPTPAADEAVEPGLIGGPAPGGRTSVLVGYGPKMTEAKRRPRKGTTIPDEKSPAAAQEAVQTALEPAPAKTPDISVERAADAATAESVAPVEPADPAEPQPVQARGQRAKVLAKPPVRKLAKALGIDLHDVTPSGPHGTVTRADVEAAANGAPVAPVDIPAGVAGPSGPRETRIPIKGVRKVTAQSMVSSAFTAPHVTEWITVDATRTVRLVERMKRQREFADVKVSPLLIVAKAVCLAVRRTPEVNATWDEAAQEIIFKSYVNLGIAAATPRGLVVPNIKDADQLSLPELALALGELTRTAREGRTQPAEMSGGTFTITNVGVFGVDSGTPILNPGESGILAFGTLRKQPWVHRGRVKPRWVTTLALSFDHRVVDGEQGSRFLADVAAIVEDPATALLF